MISTPRCPSSWKARMRWSGTPRPTWMSGEVTSMPSFTRSGRARASLRSSSPSGRTWTALRVSSARPIPGHSSRTIRGALRLRRKPSEAPRKRRRRIRKLRLLALLAVLFVLGLLAFTFGLVTAVAGQIPQYDPAHQRSLAVNSVIYDSTGQRVLAVLRGRESRTIIPSDRISPLVKQAIVAIEDQRFYEHRGVDLRGIVRAVWADLRSKRVVEGGSTITQQFVKNAIVSNQPSLTRKLKEAALAWQLEQRWSKDRILTAYLNTIYFANGAWGIAQAAETYFGKRALDLNLAEAALL